MRKLVLAAAIASLIAVPSAFAHGKSTGHHVRAHANARHAGHANRSNRSSKIADGVAVTDQANQPRLSSSRHPDEEELAVDELASKAN